MSDDESEAAWYGYSRYGVTEFWSNGGRLERAEVEEYHDLDVLLVTESGKELVIGAVNVPALLGISRSSFIQPYVHWNTLASPVPYEKVQTRLDIGMCMENGMEQTSGAAISLLKK